MIINTVVKVFCLVNYSQGDLFNTDDDFDSKTFHVLI